jgi:SNF2 family DNA or RNA helicase
MFDKPVEIALTMNLLRIPFELPTGNEFKSMFIKCTKNKRTGRLKYEAKNLDIFKERIKGYVSYYRGAPPYVYPEAKVRIVKCEMSDFQYQSYISVLGDTRGTISRVYKFREGDILDLPTNFMIGPRIISNIAFPNKSINEDGYLSLKARHLTMDRLDEYSIKFYKILSKVKRSTGPVFIYSNFKEYGGLKSLIKVLEAHKYVNYANYGEGSKRFAIWSGDEKSSMREEIKAVFNQSSNHNGSKIKIILGSPSIKEGVSLLRVRQIHILEPYWNQSRIDQIMGRGVRYCSHKDLPEEKRTVDIFIYVAVHPNEKQTVDEYILKLAQRKNNLIKEFEMALKEAAVDCTLFRNANVYPDDPEKIKCDN